MRLTRSSGIFLHPTSLPGGKLGEEAYRAETYAPERESVMAPGE